MIVYYISTLVFIAFFLVIFAVLYLISRRKDPIRRRLKDLKEGEKGVKAKLALPLEIGTERAKGTRLWLAQAGYRGPQSVSNYYGARLLCALLFGILGIVVSLYVNPQSPELIPLVAFVGILAGAYIPTFWVSRKIQRRRDQIRRSVPNMLDLMVVCVEAGLSLHAAIQKIALESKHTTKP